MVFIGECDDFLIFTHIDISIATFYITFYALTIQHHMTFMLLLQTVITVLFSVIA